MNFCQIAHEHFSSSAVNIEIHQPKSHKRLKISPIFRINQMIHYMKIDDLRQILCGVFGPTVAGHKLWRSLRRFLLTAPNLKRLRRFWTAVMFFKVCGVYGNRRNMRSRRSTLRLVQPSQTPFCGGLNRHR